MDITSSATTSYQSRVERRRRRRRQRAVQRPMIVWSHFCWLQLLAIATRWEGSHAWWLSAQPFPSAIGPTARTIVPFAAQLWHWGGGGGRRRPTHALCQRTRLLHMAPGGDGTTTILVASNATDDEELLLSHSPPFDCDTLGDCVREESVGVQPTLSSTATTTTTTKASTQPSSLSSSMPSSSTSSLGDIMNSGLRLDHQTPLSLKYGIDNPLDRMVVTANGNLQRLVSSYYDAPVTVHVVQCTLRSTDDGPNDTANNNTWDRTVQLSVHGRVFCTATSVIVVHDKICQTLVATGQVGLGQLFRHLDLLPEFILHTARPPTTTKPATSNTAQTSGLSRAYTLHCPQLTCRIHERFRPDLWDLGPGES